MSAAAKLDYVYIGEVATLAHAYAGYQRALRRTQGFSKGTRYHRGVLAKDRAEWIFQSVKVVDHARELFARHAPDAATEVVAVAIAAELAGSRFSTDAIRMPPTEEEVFRGL